MLRSLPVTLLEKGKVGHEQIIIQTALWLSSTYFCLIKKELIC